MNSDSIQLKSLSIAVNGLVNFELPQQGEVVIRYRLHEGICVMDFTLLESIELRGSTNGVGAHVFPVHPVANIHFREAALLAQAINGVAGRTPNAAVIFLLSVPVSVSHEDTILLQYYKANAYQNE